MRYIFTILTTTIITLYTHISFAGETNDIINSERLRREEIVKNGAIKNNNFEKYKKLSKQKMRDYQGLIKTIRDKHVKKAQSNGLIKPVPQAVIFVSFSMPSLSLKQIIRDGSRYQVPVVIRGLYKNSFKKTIGKIFDLVKEDNKGGVLINPVWFRKYDIKAVPAVVVNYGERVEKKEEKREKEKEKKKGLGIKKNYFDVVYGNIPLRRALKIVVERGSASKVAEDILGRVGGGR